MSDESNPRNTTGKHVSGMCVSTVWGEGESTFVFVHRGREYCHVVTSPSAASVGRVQRAQRVISARGAR